MAINIEAAKQSLKELFQKIDSNGNGLLDKSELVAVFGEHADEFLKFCDAGDKDGELTCEEFVEGIANDVKEMTEEDFQANWVVRMNACIADSVVVPATALFCMGNPLLDISCTVEPALLEKYELKANDAILDEGKHTPIYDELKAMPEVQFVPGGATQNSARVAQALLKTPKTVAYVGCVGKDAEAQTLNEASGAAGVDVAYMVDAEAATGKCGVLITDGGKARSLVTLLAAANNYKLEHTQTPGIDARIQAAQVYYSAGFFQTVSPDTMIHVAEHARDNKKIFTTNLSAPFLMMVPPFFAAIKNTLPLTDILFGNESEVAEFRNQMAADPESGFTAEMTLEEAALKMSTLLKPDGKGMVVMTQGADATVVARAGQTSSFPIIPCENLVDTNGAGDAFVGGFLAKLVANNDATAQEMCDGGNYAANVIIQQDGCTYPEAFAFP